MSEEKTDNLENEETKNKDETMIQNSHHQLKDLNVHLVCTLCGGYLIDATAIIECLHTFCRSCLVRYLEQSKFCPVCDVQVHKINPFHGIKADKLLQNLIFKIVPSLHHSEMARRKKFYSKNHSTPTSPEDGGCDIGRKYILAEDDVSIALKPLKSTDKPDKGYHVDVPARYLRCRAGVTIGQLQKLLRGKFDLPSAHPVHIYTPEDKILSPLLTIVDVSYCNKLHRNELHTFYYKIFFNKKIKFDACIDAQPYRPKVSVKPLKVPSKRDHKPPVIFREENPYRRAPLARIAPAPPKVPPVDVPYDKTPLDNTLAHSDTLFKTINLNPIPVPTQDILPNYGLSVLPMNNSIPTLIPSFFDPGITGTVLPLGISLGTPGVFCAQNPIQEITPGIQIQPFMNPKSIIVPSASIQTSVVNSMDMQPITSILDKSVVKTEPSDTNDKEVQLTISETGVVRVNGAANSDRMQGVVNPESTEVCDLLSRIERGSIDDSEDSKESDSLNQGSGKLSQIKDEITSIINQLDIESDTPEAAPTLDSSIIPSSKENSRKLESIEVPETSPSTDSRPSISSKVNVTTPKRVSGSPKNKKPQSIGYKTLKTSPKGWNPVISRDKLPKFPNASPKPNKFFKARNTQTPKSEPAGVNPVVTELPKEKVVQCNKELPKEQKGHSSQPSEEVSIPSTSSVSTASSSAISLVEQKSKNSDSLETPVSSSSSVKMSSSSAEPEKPPGTVSTPTSLKDIVSPSLVSPLDANTEFPWSTLHSPSLLQNLMLHERLPHSTIPLQPPLFDPLRMPSLPHNITSDSQDKFPVSPNAIFSILSGSLPSYAHSLSSILPSSTPDPVPDKDKKSPSTKGSERKPPSKKGEPVLVASEALSSPITGQTPKKASQNSPQKNSGSKSIEKAPVKSHSKANPDKNIPITKRDVLSKVPEKVASPNKLRQNSVRTARRKIPEESSNGSTEDSQKSSSRKTPDKIVSLKSPSSKTNDSIKKSPFLKIPNSIKNNESNSSKQKISAVLKNPEKKASSTPLKSITEICDNISKTLQKTTASSKISPSTKQNETPSITTASPARQCPDIPASTSPKAPTVAVSSLDTIEQNGKDSSPLTTVPSTINPPENKSVSEFEDPVQQNLENMEPISSDPIKDSSDNEKPDKSVEKNNNVCHSLLENQEKIPKSVSCCVASHQKEEISTKSTVSLVSSPSTTQPDVPSNKSTVQDKEEPAKGLVPPPTQKPLDKSDTECTPIGRATEDGFSKSLQEIFPPETSSAATVDPLPSEESKKSDLPSGPNLPNLASQEKASDTGLDTNKGVPLLNDLTSINDHITRTKEFETIPSDSAHFTLSELTPENLVSSFSEAESMISSIGLSSVATIPDKTVTTVNTDQKGSSDSMKESVEKKKTTVEEKWPSKPKESPSKSKKTSGPSQISVVCKSTAIPSTSNTFSTEVSKGTNESYPKTSVSSNRYTDPKSSMSFYHSLNDATGQKTPSMEQAWNNNFFNYGSYPNTNSSGTNYRQTKSSDQYGLSTQNDYMRTLHESMEYSSKKSTTEAPSYTTSQSMNKYNSASSPFYNSSYNSNYMNFLTSPSAQGSSNLSLMSGTGYGFPLPSSKVLGSQQPYFGQGASNWAASNMGSNNFSVNSSNNYQNCMNQYSFPGSNMNSNFSNFPFSYYHNYNSHFYQGDNMGIIPPGASSLMSSFQSRSSLSPRGHNGSQSIGDFSFQSGLFPMMPFVPSRPGSAMTPLSGNQKSYNSPAKPQGSKTPKSSSKRKKSSPSKAQTPPKSESYRPLPSGSQNYSYSSLGADKTPQSNKSHGEKCDQGTTSKSPYMNQFNYGGPLGYSFPQGQFGQHQQIGQTMGHFSSSQQSTAKDPSKPGCN